MKRYLSLGGAIAASTILTSTAVLAQVSATDVRDDLLTYIEASNLTVNYSESASGNGIALNNVTITVPELEAEGLYVSMVFPSITLTESGGNVDIAISPVNNIKFQVGPNGSEMNLEMMLNYGGHSMTASGTNDRTTYSYSMDSMSMVNTAFAVEGQPINGTLAFSATNSSGEYTQVNGNLMSVAGSSSIDTLSVAANLDVPGEVAMNFAFSVSDLNTDFQTATVPGLDYEDPMAVLNAINAGMSIMGLVNTGQVAMNFEFTEGNDNASVTMTTSAIEGGVLFNKDDFAFSEVISDLVFVMSGSDIPLPQIVVQAQEILMGGRAPLSASDEPRQVAMQLGVRELALQPEVWGMIDPMGAFPHDPLTAVLQASGNINMHYSVTDPMGAQQFAMAMESEQLPFTIHDFSLDELTLMGGGASITGTGSFSFDPNGMPIMPGLTMPSGSASFELLGVNSLLDTLIEMGLVPAEEAMGMRMMMGMFTVSTGDDAMSSTIEINDQGHILANGQRIQ